jgi:hypothetical protein
MLYRKILAVYSKNHVRAIIALCGENGYFLKLKPVVNIVTFVLYKVTRRIVVTRVGWN